MTRVLDMPNSQVVQSNRGRGIDLAPILDERAGSVLGKVDSVTVESGPDLLTYVASELTNALWRIGFGVRQVNADTRSDDRQRVIVSLLSAELFSESTLMFPVASAVRLRIELVDETGQSVFRREVRGAVSRELGFHKQGGPEDAQLLAEAVQQAFSSLETDRSFLAALQGSHLETSTMASDPAPLPAGTADRLSTLDRLRDEGLINQDEYEQKRGEILDDL